MISEQPRKLWYALLLSLSAHILIWLFLLWNNTAIDHTRYQKPIEVTVLDANEQKELAEKDAKNTVKIIEQDEQRVNDEKPKDAKYLGRHDQSVVQETRVANAGQFNNQAGSQGVEITEAQPKKTKQQKPRTLSDLGPKFKLEPEDDKKQATAKGRGPASTNDYLPDVQVGAQTVLNSREFVYYSYYHRIREQLRQQWEPRIREKVRQIFSTGRSIASTADKITKVIIVLNTQGNLVKVQVIGQSGVQDLDDAAVEAFRAAEPFPNPPQGIVEQDGFIRIRWDFVLEASWIPTQPDPQQTAMDKFNNR